MAELLKKEILNKEHPDWEQFISDLQGSLQVEVCKQNLDITRQILEQPEYTNIDVKGTIKWLESKGGYCDCEILMNVACEDNG